MQLAINSRNQQASEQLQLLCMMRSELEAAMLAIAQNRLSDLEESIAEQAALVARLRSILGGVSSSGGESGPDEAAELNGQEFGQDITEELLLAGRELQRTARIYARLLRHSSHSAALMASLLGSMRERGKEASGSRPGYHTWSCQV